MGIVVETGAGISSANSYGALADANAYHADRNNAAWAAAPTIAREAALIVATDYLEAFYSAPAAPLNAAQALQWPTVALAAVPARLRAATYLLALEALGGPLRGSSERGTKRVRKKLDGVGETETEFDDAAPGDRFPSITAMLDGIASPKGLGGVVVGKLTR